jgi:uncharacterized protein (TIGR02284 family)
MDIPELPAIADEEAALLNSLLDLNLDSKGGYTAAANVLHNRDYAELFHQYAEERRQNATELSELLRTSGHTPDQVGTIPGLFHQGWINLESILVQGDAPIFATCEQADALTLSAYQDVMGQTTREELMAVLRRQFTRIRNAHDRVKALGAALAQAHQ